MDSNHHFALPSNFLAIHATYGLALFSDQLTNDLDSHINPHRCSAYKNNFSNLLTGSQSSQNGESESGFTRSVTAHFSFLSGSVAPALLFFLKVTRCSASERNQGDYRSHVRSA